MSALTSVHSVANCLPGGHTVGCKHRQLLYAILDVFLSYSLYVFLVL